MTIHFGIQGETAEEVLEELRKLAEGLHPQRTSGGSTRPGPIVGMGVPKATDRAMTDEEAIETASRSGRPAAVPDDPEKPAKATKPARTKAAKPAPEEPADPPAKDEEITIDDVKRTVRKYLGTFDENAKGQKAAQALLLDNFDVKKVTDLAEDQYAKAISVFESAIEDRASNDED